MRALAPLAHAVDVLLPDDSRHPMEHEYDGIWVASVPQTDQIGRAHV